MVQEDINHFKVYIFLFAFNAPDSITYHNQHQTYIARFTYLPNGERIKMTLSNQQGQDSITKYYAQDYDIKLDTYHSTDDTFAYLYSPQQTLVAVRSNQTLMYTHTDYQGSVVGWLNSYGELVAAYSYDAWGKPRYHHNWTYNNLPGKNLIPPFDRGYTAHEHLLTFQLINMNARLYDPETGRMLACDNFVQDP